MGAPQLKSFRESKWRYIQFVVVALVVAGIVKLVSPLTWLVALAIGAVAGIGYFLFEKKRGVI